MRVRSGVVGVCATLLVAFVLMAPPASAGTTAPTITRINTIPDQVIFTSSADFPLSISVETDEPAGWTLNRATFRACSAPRYGNCTPQEQWLSVQSISSILQRHFVTFAGSVPNVANGQLNRYVRYAVDLTYTSPTGASYTLSSSSGSGSYCYYACSMSLYGDSTVSLDGPDHVDAGTPVTLTGKVTCFTRDGFTSPPVDAYGYAGWVDLYYRVTDASPWKYAGSADSFNADTGEFRYSTSGATADWKANYWGNTCWSRDSAVHHVDAGATPPPPPPPALPGAPGLSVKSKTYSSVTLDWTPPADTGASPVIGYHFGWTSSNGLPQGQWNRVYDTSAPDPLLIANLSPETTYSVWVAAITKDGEGKQATVAVTTSAAPGNPPPAPHKPGRVSIVAHHTTTHTATITWKKPASNGGAPIASYQVHRRGHSHEVGRLHRSWRFTTLHAHTHYRLYVRAKNAAGFGPWRSVLVRTKR